MEGKRRCKNVEAGIGVDAERDVSAWRCGRLR